MDCQVMRSALGRVGFLGELYDCRTESLSSRTVFKSSLPPCWVQNIQVNNTAFEYKFTESVSDRFDLLNVEAELQVGLLCGLFETQGSGKFLNRDQKSQESVSCSLVYKFETVCEKFFASSLEIIESVDCSAFEDSSLYTHVITEITWGGNSVLNLEMNCTSDTNKNEIKGLLSAEMKKLSMLFSVKAGGEVNYEKSSFLNNKDVTIEVTADVVPEQELPTTIEGFCQFVRDTPLLMKKVNGGKGKPLRYGLVPLSTIAKLARFQYQIDTFASTIDEGFLISIVCLFEQITSVKVKLSNLVKRVSDFAQYLPTHVYTDVRNKYENLKLRECQLKTIVASDLIPVKSRMKSLKDLIRTVEKFRARDLNLSTFEDFLTSSSSIQNKINDIVKCISAKIDYLERGKHFAEELNRKSLRTTVLVICSQYKEDDPVLYQKTRNYFFLLATDRNESNAKFVIVDLDLDASDNVNRKYFTSLGVMCVRCLRFVEGRLDCADLYDSYVSEQNTNFVQIRKSSRVEMCTHKPGNRTLLVMTCPGFANDTFCPNDKLTWKCIRCKQFVEYGFDDYFYCSCGRQNFESCEYRCCSPHHGVLFLSAEPGFLINELSSLRPLDELNILVIGPSGVGKSTWINAIVNYLSYDSFDVAKEKGPICTIPISFDAYDRQSGKKHVIEIGEKSASENVNVGESGTQTCTTYTFKWAGKQVRLIDTPGIGDTRGLCQDKNNIQNIMEHISHLKELHGVCILIRANDSRLDVIFSYCIEELLAHVHKSIASNIVFCYTNARNSFYSPGQSAAVLEKLIQSKRLEKQLPLGKHNQFCLDNEAFIFLCTLTNSNISHDEHLVKSFAQSWDISLNETQRLFSTVANFQPHFLSGTVALYKARKDILLLSKPLAEISKTIQMNLSVISKKKDELKLVEKNMSELYKKLCVNQIKLETTPLSFPRTVCTSSKCIRYSLTQYGITEILYETECHRNCAIPDVMPKAINNVHLEKCIVMRDGKCTKCGCAWQVHMHLTVDQKLVTIEVESQDVKEDLLKEENGKAEIERFLENLENRTKMYEEEQEIIIAVSVKLATFLRENALNVYNDALADYLKYLIQEEENKPNKTKEDENLLLNLKETFNRYNTEMNILKQIVGQSKNNENVPSVEEIGELIEQLYNLPLSGANIKKYTDVGREAYSKFQYRETNLKLGEGCCVPRKPIQKNNPSWWPFPLTKYL